MARNGGILVKRRMVGASISQRLGSIECKADLIASDARLAAARKGKPTQREEPGRPRLSHRFT